MDIRTPEQTEPVCGVSEELVAEFVATLTDAQKSRVCFSWEHTHPVLGLLRRRLENDWRITKPRIESPFYSPLQQRLLREIFRGLISPRWLQQVDFALQQDSGGFGKQQTIAVFQDSSLELTQLVFTSRHMTLRCNNDPGEPCAFGGPIFLGHEGASKNALDPASNVFWYQAIAATEFFEHLTDDQQRAAMRQQRPREGDISFRPAQPASGLPISQLSESQKPLFEQFVARLVEPFREADAARFWKCFDVQGGSDRCRISFFSEGGQLDGVWRCWQIDGPSLLWYFRGTPHIHIWIHVADRPNVPTNAANSYDLLEWRYGKKKRRNTAGTSNGSTAINS